MIGWELKGTYAQLLSDGDVICGIEVTKPDQGLLGLDRETVPLQIRQPEGIGARLSDRFLRGKDLVADYGCDDDVRYQIRLYWSAKAMPEGTLIDFSAVVRTPAWVCTPQFTIVTGFDGNSKVAHGTVSPPPSDGGGRLEWATVKVGQQVRSPGPCMVQDRESIRLIEMVFPTDFQQMERSDDTLGYQLLGEPLEKGVIRTVRIRTILKPTIAGESGVDQLWSDFLAEPVPLTP